ncbi:MAG: hypothetical protein ACOYON_05955 [Fimbriimonas sp.]
MQSIRTLRERLDGLEQEWLESGIPVLGAPVTPVVVAKAPAPVAAPVVAPVAPPKSLEVVSAPLNPETAPEPVTEVLLLQPVVSDEKKAIRSAAQRELRRRMQSFEMRVEKILERPVDSRVEAEIKSLVCEARGMQVLEAEAGTDDFVRRELEQLREKFNDEAEDPEFFGFNNQRSHASEIWFDLADAYGRLGAACEAIQWLENVEGLDVVDHIRLYDLIAAADASLFRIFSDRGLSVTDGQQRRLHEKLRELQPEDHFVPYWKTSGDDRMSKADIDAEANQLAAFFTSLEQRTRKRMVGERAMDRLVSLVREPSEGDFEEHIVRIVEDALNGGIPPTNKRLTEILLPYRHLLDGVPHAQGRKLKDHLDRQATLLQSKPIRLADEDEAEDPAHEARLEAVRNLLTGKTILFVGGNKGQAFRQAEYERDLRVKLLWPDMEDATNMNALRPSVEKADLVCLLIRFSRHSYKKALDDAKASGKMTAILARGLGFRTIVHDLYAQLCAGQEEAA